MFLRPATSAVAPLWLLLSVFVFVSTAPAHASEIPGKSFNLKKWKLTLPIDSNSDGKLDEAPESHLPKFSFKPFFYSPKKGEMVFISPTKVLSKNGTVLKPRNELRLMLRAGDKNIKTNDPKNSFALEAHKKSTRFASVGTRLEASLSVSHVPKTAIDPSQGRAYTVVVGQINTAKDKSLQKGKGGYGFGYGNEPLKIYYKKWPDHETGSLFWTYERNLAADNPNRKDIVYPIWGETWDSRKFPGYHGIALDEEFSYVINIYENTLELSFSADDRDTRTYIINLADNVDANGEVDAYDNPNGYTGDSFYLRAGAYNQCTSSKKNPSPNESCAGTGDWPTDYKNGNFSAVKFTKLKLGKPKPIKLPSTN